MERPGLVDQQELIRWADSIAARSEFPRLVRRLVLETTTGVVQLGFPAGAGTSTAGWDGTVRATRSTAFVPAGLSLWELSVEKGVGTKADSDYAKRTATPDGSATASCTYVAASLRRWAARATWALNRCADARWHEVRALGVDDIEAWLETAPVTWAWISERLGLHPFGLRSAEAWWDAWSAQTTPPVTSALVRAGRTAEVDGLTQRLAGPAQIITISGPSREEVQAFITAVGVKTAEDGDGQLLARIALVDDIAAWRSLIDQQNPLVLVPVVDGLASEVPSQCVHHIVVPVVGSAVADIELSPLDAHEATAALTDAGMTDAEKAEQAGRLARRSLTALRRNIANKPELHLPLWASSSVSRDTRGVLLAGSWSDTREGDQQVLSDLVGEDYDHLRERLNGLASSEDPFIAIDGGKWNVVSLYDAWLLLRSHLREDDLTRLDAAVTLVLGEEDPALDLPEDERWKANLEGKVRSFSGTLRRGLAKTLALLGVHGETVRASHGETGANWASYLVRKLLAQANEDRSGRRWTSIADLLPLLAEAGPDSVLDAVRAGLSGSDPLLAQMFTDTDGDGLFSSSSPHTGLLWALENLAWSSEHFGAAVDLLARLDAIDPGGRLSNRPFRSLGSIFTPWHPDNSVGVERRLDVIDGLRKRHPETAWLLLLSMLPEFQGIHMPIHEPQFRDWKPPRTPVTNVEYFGFVSEIASRSVADAGVQPERWGELLDRATQLPPHDRSRVVEALHQLVEAGSFNDINTAPLWQSLRESIGKHRDFADTADWALPREETDALDALAAKLEPKGAFESSLWLFTDHMPHLGDEKRRSDHAAYDAELAQMRRAAVEAVEAEGGLDAVRRLAASSVVGWSVGVGLADATSERHEVDLLPHLNEVNQGSDLELAFAYFARRFVNGGWIWLEALLTDQSNLSPLQKARLLLATRDLPKAWEVADEKSAEVADEFWRFFSPLGLGGDFSEIETVARRLMGVRRYATALRFIDIYARRGAAREDLVSHLVAEALEGLLAIQADDPELAYLSQYEFEESFKLLERQVVAVGEDRVASLEWAYLSALGFHPDVPSLHRRMAVDPAFFVEIVNTVYGPRGGQDEDSPAEEADSTRERRATNAYHLLSSWGQLPGLQDDGRLDSAGLRDWVQETLLLLRESDRYEVGQVHIGKALVSAPADADGTWPSEPVRDLLEELQSEEIEEGFFVEVLNRRGVTTRGLEDGGEQERRLVERYREDAKRLSDQSPRAAAILRKLTKSYENEARRNEESAERFRRGLER